MQVDFLSIREAVTIILDSFLKKEGACTLFIEFHR